MQTSYILTAYSLLVNKLWLVISVISGIFLACQDPSQTTNTVRSASVSIAWSSMREAVLELQGSTGLEVGLIASREATAPDYNTVSSLPSFYSRKMKANSKRTVYISMTDKMTEAALASAAKPVDGSVAGFDPLTANPEILHPNTEYQVYAYYKRLASDSTYTVVSASFTTEDWPTSFPTSQEAWSALYSKYEAGPDIEYKTGESYLIAYRMYYLPMTIVDPELGLLINFFTESFDLIYSSDTKKTPAKAGSIKYDLYNIRTPGPSATPSAGLFDLLLLSRFQSFTPTVWSVEGTFDGDILRLSAQNKFTPVSE